MQINPNKIIKCCFYLIYFFFTSSFFFLQLGRKYIYSRQTATENNHVKAMIFPGLRPFTKQPLRIRKTDAMHVTKKRNEQQFSVPAMATQEGEDEPPDPGSCLAGTPALPITPTVRTFGPVPRPPYRDSQPGGKILSKKAFSWCTDQTLE